MRYGNAVIKEYPNSQLVNVAVFNRIIVNDFEYKIKHIRDKDTLTDDELQFQCDEAERIARQRAIHKIFDIAMLNNWTYFVTFTFNDKIQDASDFKGAIEKVKKWCDNAVQRKGLKYLLIPELHKDRKRVHLHGFLYFDIEPKIIFSGHFDKSHRPIYNLPMWRYGFSTIVKLDSGTIDRTSRYVTKYITKDVGKIAGNYYYAGGKDLVRNRPPLYANVDFDSFDSPITTIKDGLYVKYVLMTKEQALNLHFQIDNDIEF